jgi:hypothetical protein
VRKKLKNQTTNSKNKNPVGSYLVCGAAKIVTKLGLPTESQVKY